MATMAESHQIWPSRGAHSNLFSKYSTNVWTYNPNSSCPVRFRDKEYPSASAALEDYINEYDGNITESAVLQRSSRIKQYEREIDSLLISQGHGNSCGHDQPVRGYKIGAQAQVERLASIKKMVDEAYSKLVDKRTDHHHPELTGETVEEALNRSQQVINTVARDGLTSLPNSTAIFKPLPSESITTESLVQAEPITMETVEERLRSSHFRQSRQRSPRVKMQRVNEISDHTLTAREQKTLAKLRDFHQKNSQQHSGSTGTTQMWQLPEKAKASTSRMAPSWVQDLADMDGDATLTADLTLNSEAGRSLSVTDLSASPLRHLRSSQRRPSDEVQGHFLDSGLRHSGGINIHSGGLAENTPGGAISLEAEITLEHTPTGHSRGDLDLYSSTTDDLLLSTPNGDKMHSLSRKYRHEKRHIKFEDSTQNDVKHQIHEPPSIHMSTNVQSETSTNGRYVIDSDKDQSPIIAGHSDVGQSMGGRSYAQLDSNDKHRQYIRQLLKDIEDSSSSVVTEIPEESPSLSPEKKNMEKSDRLAANEEKARRYRNEGDGNSSDSYGFLFRINKLLADAPSAVNVESHDDELTTSPDTEVILDGDRPWETNTGPLNPPKFIPESEECSTPGEKKRVRIVDKFIDDCLATSKETMVPSGGETNCQQDVPPGGSWGGARPKAKKDVINHSEQKNDANSDREETQIEPKSAPTGAGPNVVAVDPSLQHLLSTSFENPPVSQSLERAMQHLTTLKNLVDNQNTSAAV